MAKSQKLSSLWNVTASVLSITIEARDLDASKDAATVAKFERSITLPEAFGAGYPSLNEAGTAALEFGVFTALRNATGSASDIDEAQAAFDRRLEAFQRGEWGAEREQSSVPFTENHILCKAVEMATKGAQTAAEAAAKLGAHAEAICAANSLGAFATLDPADRAKIRKAVIDAVKSSKPVIAAALAKLESDRDEAALARKREAAAKALAAAGDQVDTGL